MVGIVSGNSLGLGNSSLATLGQRAAQGNASQGRGGEQVFVNVASGNLVIAHNDDQLVAHGGGFQAVRTYNSQGLLNDDNADNWSAGFYRRQLVLSGTYGQPGSTITRTERDGASALFSWDASSSSYVSTDGAGAYDRIVQQGSSYVFTDGATGNREFHDTATGRLDKSVDASGNTTTYTYDANGNIAKLVNPSGESIQYDYTGNLLSRIRVVDSQGATTTRTSYTYDTRNRLSQVTVDLTPQDGSTADGKLYRTSYTYHGDSNRIATLTQSDGSQLTIDYVQVGSEFKVSSLRDALGQTTRFAYDTATRTTQVTDPAGKVSSYAYDAKGQLLSITSPATNGVSSVQRFEYNANGDLIRSTDANGRTVFMAYDANGNQVLQRDGAGNTITRTYNAQNRLLSETVYTQPDPDGDGAAQASGAQTTRYVYDDATGLQLRFAVSAEGRVTEYRRNAYGEVVSTLQHQAARYGATGASTEAALSAWSGQQNLQQLQRTDYVLDFRGQAQVTTTYATTDAAGNGLAAGSTVTRHIYDQAGRLLQTIDGNGGSTSYAYDGLGRLLTVTDAKGQVTTTTYDDMGRRIVVLSANGLQEVRSYDSAGRLISNLRQDTASASASSTTAFTYDATGRLVSTQDATGVRQWNVYDDAGRKVAEVDGTGAATEYRYNASGQLVQTIAYAKALLSTANAPTLQAIQALAEAGDHKSWRIYDDAQRLVWQIGPQGEGTRTDYDGASRIVAVTQLATPMPIESLGDGSLLVARGTGIARIGTGSSGQLALQAIPVKALLGEPVRIVASGAGLGNGSVVFKSGSTVLGTVKVVNGVAEITLNNLPSGLQAISASHVSDSGEALASTGALSVQIQQRSETSLQGTPSSITVPGRLTLTAKVSGSNPQGTVSFFQGETLLGVATVSAGKAILDMDATPALLLNGANAITLRYSGDALHQASVASATVNAVHRTSPTPSDKLLPTLETLRISPSMVVLRPNSIDSGPSISFSVAVKGSAPGGTVTFLIDGKVRGAAAVVNGMATLKVKATDLEQGPHDVVASYSGDAVHQPQQLTASGALQVMQLPPQATAFNGTVRVSTGSETVLRVQLMGPVTPTGRVDFYSNGQLIGSAALDASGAATLDATALLLAGEHSIEARYAGDTNNSAVVSRTSKLTLLPAPADIQVSTSASRILQGESIELTARLAPEAAQGQVTFYANGQVVGVANVTAGLARLTTTALQAVGNAQITASYTGSAEQPSSVRTNVAQVQVDIALQPQPPATQAQPTRTELTVSGSMLGLESIRLTASIDAAGGTPGGTVSFYDGDLLVGTASVVNGKAVLKLAAHARTEVFTSGATSLYVPAAGTRTLRAVYSGDSTLASSAASTTRELQTGFLPDGEITAQRGNDGRYELGFSSFHTSGPISFYSDGILLGTAALVDGWARLTGIALTQGAHTITASYPGSAIYRDGIVARDVSERGASQLVFDAQGVEQTAAGTVLRARVQGTASGSISFFSEGKLIGSATVINGTATLTTSALAAGLHNISAIYSGDDTNLPGETAAIAVTLEELSVPADTRAPSQLSIDGNANDDPVTIRIANGGATGKIYVFSDRQLLGEYALVDGQARIPAGALPAGNRSILFAYTGDGAHQPAEVRVQINRSAAAEALPTVLGIRTEGNLLRIEARAADGGNGSFKIFRNGLLVQTVAASNGAAAAQLDKAMLAGGEFWVEYSEPASGRYGSSDRIQWTSLSESATAGTANVADRATRHFYDADGLRTGTLDAEGYLVALNYDAAGRLASTTRFANATNAAKRATGTLAELMPASNSQDIIERRLYDGQGRLAGTVDGAGYLTAFGYDAAGQLTSQTRYATALKAAVLSTLTSTTAVAGIRPATNAQDRTSTLEYDKLGQLTAETDWQGTRTEHSYDAAGNRTASTVAAGTSEARTRQVRYDALGRITAELSAEGARQLAAAQTPAQVEAVWSSYASRHTYDAAGRRTSTTDANGLRTLFFYNAENQLTHTINALGEVAETRYNALGQVSAQVRYGTRINPGSLTGSLAGGLVNSTLQSLLQAATSAAQDQTTQYTYNTNGTLASERDALGFTRNYVYNTFREETQRTEATGTGTTSTLLQTTYDRRGLATGQVRDAGGLALTTAANYDAFGRQVSATDALGHTRTRAYDRLGREVSSTDSLWATLTTTYDAFSRIVTQVNAEGGTTRYAYDAKARTVTITTDEGLLAKQTYNRHGDQISVSDSQGHLTTYTFDANGQPTGSSASTWLYDAKVMQTAATTQAYDKAGRLIETVDANGTRTTIAYDAANRVLSRTVDPTGLALTTQYAYDPLGRQIRITEPGGTVTELRYDARGQLLEQIVDPAGLALSTRYSYDAQGHALEVTSPEGTLTRYTYDAAGRRTKEQIDPSGLNLTRSYTYDAGGNVTSSVDANGNTSYYLYDSENRQILAVDGAGGVKETRYDALGRISRLTTYRNPLTGIDLQVYVNNGPVFGPSTWPEQVMARIAPTASDRIEYRSYDANNHLQSVVTGLGEVTTYLRDGNGRIQEQRSYANRISIGGTGGWTPGTFPTPVADDARDLRTRMVYDGMGRLIATADGTGAVTGLRYDAAGNVVERVRYAQTVTLGSDPYDSAAIYTLIAQDSSAANAVEKNTYDRAGRLTWSADAAGSVTAYQYDRDGRVVKKARFASAITAGQQPQDVVQAGALSTDYVYDAAGRQTHIVGADGAVVRQVWDRNGNLRQRTEFATLITPPVFVSGAVMGPIVTNYDRSNIGSALRSSANDRTTSLAYDKANRQVLEVNAAGAVRQIRYDKVFVVTAASTGTGTSGAAQQKLHSQTVTAYANTVDLSALGVADITLERVMAMLQPNASQDRETTQILDGANRTVRTIDANGYATAREYDGTGQLTHLTEYADKSGSASAQDRHTRYSYDGAGRLASTTDALGNRETYAYNALGQKTAFTNKAGATWNYDYDAAGRLVRETSPAVDLAAVKELGGTLVPDAGNTGSQRIVTQLAYDSFGNLTSRTEAAGRPEQRSTRYEYDKAGRQVKTIFPGVGVYQAESPAALLGNNRLGEAARVETRGVELSSETRYDALGNAVASRAMGIPGTKEAWSYKSYDRAGRVSFDVDAAGFVTGYTRNAWGETERLVRHAQAIALPSPAGTALADATVRQSVQASHPANREILTSYDRMGRTLTVQEPQVFNYDSQTGETVSGRKSTGYGYNAFGDQTSVFAGQGSARWSTTTHAYDKLGRRVATTDALGYLTTMAYDASGSLVRQVEYAKAWQTAGTAPDTAAGDRVTDYSYDLMGRKSAEIRRSVAHTGVNAAAQEQKDVLYDKREDLTTRFSYDALGNLTRTTDALGGVTYNFYDVLGRVRATITPAMNLGVAATGAGANPINPLTEFQRDAHGNVLLTTQFANGASVAADGSSYTRVASGNDRVTTAQFDAQGHTTQITDAQGYSRYYAYDAQGRLAKEWQTVTSHDKNGTASQASLWRAYSYDVLGRQTHSYAPSESIALGTLSVSDTELSYNAFGEVTQKRVLDNGQELQGVETYDYDNAGRVWRTNAGDGVYKVLAYDMQGRQTAQLISEGLDLKTAYQDAQSALNAQAANKAQFRRTDMRYDALGRLVQTLAPERATEQPMGITTRQNMLYGVISQSEVIGDRNTGLLNQVDLVWRSLEDLGSGDVRITLTYNSAPYLTPAEGDSTGDVLVDSATLSRSVIVPAEAALEGYSFQWRGALNMAAARGISSLNRITVEKQDVFGKWQTLYNVAGQSQPASLNWTEGSSPGQIWNEAGDGRIPIYRYYNRYTDTHHFTTSLTERERLLNQAKGWLDEGTAGYVSRDPQPGLIPLYRWTKAGDPDVSLYTNGGAPSAGGSWQNQGIEGYVAPSSPNVQGMTKLYRLDNKSSGRGDGLYTTSITDRNALLGLPRATFGGSSHTSPMFAKAMGLSIEVSYPQDLVSKTTLEYRRYGSNDGWTTAPVGIQTSFGSAHRFDVSQFPAGNYEYRVRNTNAQMTRDVGSGTFTIGAESTNGNLPPLPGGVEQGSAIIDGYPYRVLQWPKPAAGWTVEFRYWPQGNSSAVTTRTAGNGLFAYGDGRTVGMGINRQGVAVNWGPGSIEYEVIATNTATGEKVHATGQVGTPGNVAMTNVSPAPVLQNRNVTNQGVVGYVWSSPGPGRTPLHRFLFTYQDNQHHLTTADPTVYADFQRLAASGGIVYEGVLGYVETSPSATNQRLYQYKYGASSVYRLTANPRDINGGSFVTLNSKPAPNYPWAPTTWYQSAYQFDGYISKVPADGMVPLYAAYNGNAMGNQPLGDYLTATEEYDITMPWVMGAEMIATANVPGVGTSQAAIDGQIYNMLHWSAPEAGARVKVSSYPSLPGGTPTLWRQGDNRIHFPNWAPLQGIVLDALTPNATYTITIEIEYPATAQHAAYVAKSIVKVTVPSSSAISLKETTPPYTETVQTRVWAGTPFNLSNRAVTNREYDRWGNLTGVDDPRVQAGQTLFKTSFTYNASNQLTSQTQLASYEGPTEYTTTRIYYDALGRQVGVRDGMRDRDSLLNKKDGNLNAQVRDLAGNVVQERKADGGRIDLSYNAFGDKTSAAERMTTTRTVVTDYSYDKLSRLTSTALASTSTLSRFELGSVNGAVTNGVNGSVHAANGVSGADPQNAIALRTLETIQYDEAGRKVRVINGNNEATRYRYDLAGNVTMSGQEQVKSTASPAVPGPTVTLGGLSNVNYYRYDALGRKIGFTGAGDGASAMTQDWSYDIFGRLTARSDSQLDNGARVYYQYAYNKAGQLTHEGTTQNNIQRKSLDYRYDGAGQLIEIKDNYLGQLSSYTYDLAGNRLTEKLTQKTKLASGLIENVVYQDNHLFYDAQNRLRASFDGRSDVRISYDLSGNRSQVTTRVINNLYKVNFAGKWWQSPGWYDQVDNASVTTYAYDAMNRQTVSREEQIQKLGLDPKATTIVTTLTHNYAYDLAGNRTSDITREQTSGKAAQETINNYVYDDLHRLDSFSISQSGKATQFGQVLYDGAGRQIYAKTLSSTGEAEHRYNQYDTLGRVQDTRVVMRRADNQQKIQHTDVAYHGAPGTTDPSLGYDAAGNLRGQVQTTNGNTGDATRTTYKYQFNGSYQQIESTTTQGGRTATTNTWRDANGFISNIEQKGEVYDTRYNRAFVNDAQGNALYVNQSAGTTADKGGRIQNEPGGYIGGFIGDAINPGHVQRQLVANGEVLARYGDAPDSENPPKAGDVPKYVNTAEFHLNAPALKLRDTNFSAMSYTVVGGETLKTIARNVLGDSSLWWRIADANGLAVSGDGELTAGQTLSIPKLALNANNADTFQPYDPSRVTGSLDSVLPAPAGQGGGCGALGKIIMVAVAVVVAIYAPQFLANMGVPGLISGAGATATTSAMGAAVGGAAGSIASQVAGNVMGVQDGFSWKSVALSALSGGITKGLAGTELLGGTDWQSAAMRAATANAMTQGIGVVTGLQDRFDWKSVAASAAGGAVGSYVDGKLKTYTMFNGGGNTAADLARGTISGFAAGTAAALARGGRISIQQVATDAFGNALGDSLADVIRPPDVLGQFIDQQLQAQDRRDLYGLASASNAAYARLGKSPDNAVQQWSDDIDAMIRNGGSNRAQREAYTLASTADASGTIGRSLEMIAGTVKGTAQWVSNGLQFVNDQGWAIANAFSGGQLIENNEAARASFERNSALTRGLLALPEKASVAALRLMTGNMGANEISQATNRALRADEIAALEAQGDYAGASAIRTENALSILSLAAGSAPAMRGVLGLASETILPGARMRVEGFSLGTDNITGNIGSATLAETGVVDRLLYGARVGEGLPGAEGIIIARRPTIDQMVNLSEKHGVEFATTYNLGSGKNGGGGYYTLYSGGPRSVSIGLIEGNKILVNHTHPRGTANASGYWFDTARNMEVYSPSENLIRSGTVELRGDQGVLQRLIDAGSPQRSSVVIPGASPGGNILPPFRFDVNNKNIDYTVINDVVIPKNR
ncbi:Ig-like domain repeat protein [Delftia tsuruhatensis]|uniref:Ig-like domain repeat protein n=2 Tax=Pseudomonadota TaxID=1224 RepID=UPI00370A65F4